MMKYEFPFWMYNNFNKLPRQQNCCIRNSTGVGIKWLAAVLDAIIFAKMGTANNECEDNMHTRYCSSFFKEVEGSDKDEDTTGLLDKGSL